MKFLLKPLSMLLAASLFVSCFVLSSAEPSRAYAEEQPPMRDIAIGHFETAQEGWIFSPGAEFPGAKGGFALDSSASHAGEYSGKLTADFGEGGNYVSVGRSFSPTDAKALTFWLKSADLAVLGLRLTDSTGQTHQQRIPVASGSEWQQITVSRFDGGQDYIHWGGANDGIWHGPAGKIAFLVDKSRLINKLNGSIWLDEVILKSPMPPLLIEQVKTGNVFIRPETASFRVLSSGDTVTSSVYDYWGDPVAVLTNPIESGTATIAVPPLAPGYYTLKAAAERGGSPIAEAETAFAVLTPNDISQAGDSPFGMSTHFGQTSKASWTPELIPLLALAGSKNIRDELYWNVVEKEKGVYTFPESYERFMSGLRESRIDPFIIYSYTNKFHDHDSTPYTDEGRQGFAEYGRAIQRHYEGQVKWAEVYNEFNIAFGDRGDGPADSRPDYYVKLLKRTYETVKAEFPDVTLVGPASAGIPWTWLEEVFKLGGLSYMDAVSIHPYRYPAAPETLAADLAKLRELIKKYNNGQTKPIWITELGWPTQLDARGVPENVQAENIVRSHVVSLSEGVQKIFWYDFMNDGLNELHNEDNFGIVRHPEDPKGKFAPKPAYAAYAAMTRELTGADFKHKDEVGGGIYSYAFEGEQGTTRVAWSTEPKQVKVKTDVPIIVMDIMGGAETLTPFAGYVYLTLTGEPVYIRGDAESITEGSKFALSGVQATTADPIPVGLAVDNTESPKKRIVATLEIEGQSHGIDVMPGSRQELQITLPRSETPGTKTVTGYVVSEGKQVARLMARIPVVDPVRVQSKHIWSDGGDTVRVRIGNHLNRDYALERIEWRIGDEQGVADAAQVIPAGGEGSADIPVPGLPAGQSYPVTLTLHALDTPAVVHRSEVRLVAPDAMKPFAERSIEVDGIPDELNDVPSVALPGDGKVQMKGYGGEEDLSGQVAVTWDEAYLYLSAKIKDDAFNQKAAEQDIWQGDSIQFSVSSGMPGEMSEWHEFGIALTAQGPQLYRWLAPKGGQTGLVSGGKLAIKRDDATRHTVYELAIPWSELTPIAAEDGLIGFSFLVNDDDGQGRKGWIEWGAGIGGTKDSALFQPARLVPKP